MRCWVNWQISDRVTRKKNSYHKCSEREVKPDAARRKRKSSLPYQHIRVSLLPGSRTPHTSLSESQTASQEWESSAFTNFPKEISVATAASGKLTGTWSLGFTQTQKIQIPERGSNSLRAAQSGPGWDWKVVLSCWLRLKSFPFEDCWVMMSISQSWKHSSTL